MKVFVSWSGELSKEVAQILKKWIPCIIQSVEVFFSPEDIEKGENWDKKISAELSNCNYGIICLTSENITAPWINFEAGAIAKCLDSHVTALMVNIKPSDIKGPLSRYQATKFEHDDFWRLIENINKLLDSPLERDVLKNTFEVMWCNIEEEVKNKIGTYIINGEKININNHKSEPLEEILQLLRKQNIVLNDSDTLLTVEYLKKNGLYLVQPINGKNIRINRNTGDLCNYYAGMLLEFLENTLYNISNYKEGLKNIFLNLEILFSLVNELNEDPERLLKLEKLKEEYGFMFDKIMMEIYCKTSSDN